MDARLRSGIIETARAIGANPIDLATVISFETAGTFDPTKAGPTTKWGRHRGLIQFGEPQAAQHGVDWNDPVGSQLGPNGAVASYLRASGFKPGMGLLDLYSTINAGAPGLYDRSDTAAGGTPGSVRDKVETQMAGHVAKAAALLGQDIPEGSNMNGILSTQGQTPPFNPQAEQPKGILGALSNPDFLDRLAMGLTGMTLNPNQGIIATSGAAIKGRQEERATAMKQKADEQARNATLEWLRSQPDGEQFAGLVDGIGGAGALQAYFQSRQLPEDERTSGIKEYERAVSEGFEGNFIDYKTQLAQAGRAETNVNVGTGETAFSKKTGEVLAQEAADIVAQGSQAQRSLGQISTLETALRSAPSGALGSLTNMAANLGIKTEGASDIELANSIISQLVPQQRPPGSGVMSDADLALFKQSLPRLINSAEGNQKIVDTMKAIAEYDIQRAQIARQLQLGQISQEAAFEAYNALGNPVAEFVNNPQAATGGTKRMRFNPQTGALEPVQ